MMPTWLYRQGFTKFPSNRHYNIRDDEDVKPDISETEQLDKDLNRKSRVNIIKGKFSSVKKKFGAESESKYGMKSEFRCEGRYFPVNEIMRNSISLSNV
ncbi:hypothetical protein TNCV_3761841 [Trichonephila clavipes]|nr:hypothetical protein TNCV_3761841 [Trichonephila clavipes]